MNVQFERITEPSQDIVDCLNRWENDPALTPLIRPNKSQADLERTRVTTLEDLADRLEDHHMYLISLDGRPIGEMDYQVGFPHLYKDEPGTAWIGINIGEEEGRGKGIGRLALEYLEREIMSQGLTRIELGVFEFNAPAIRLYQKLGYQEIVRLDGYTYWDGRMWQDVRMEKYLRA